MDSITTIAKATSSRKSVKARKPVKCHRPRKESTKTITTRLYRMWSDIAHALAHNKCEVCGITGKLDAHHIQPRQICSGLRFDPRNACCLCSSHHKFGRQSAHKGMLWFVDWFKNKRPEDYKYLMANLDSEIDCKNRMSLYRVEYTLVSTYGKINGAIQSPMHMYSVDAIRRDGEFVHSDIQASNPKMAETVFYENWPKTEPRLKGIVKTEKIKTSDPAHVDKIVAMKNDLLGRGIIDKDGNLMSSREARRPAELAKWAIVNEAMYRGKLK